MLNGEEQLIDALVQQGVLKTPRVIAAFRSVPRASFTLPEYRDDAAANSPLPIGFGQTISQPLTVAMMLELLAVEPGQRILDVGAGSGWTAALLASLTGSGGLVTAIERIPQLAVSAEEHLRAAGFSAERVRVVTGDGALGRPGGAPYDRIHVAAAAHHGIPPALREQLAVGGRLVIPVGRETQDVVLLERTDEEQFNEQSIPGFQFVPLIEGER